jgi:transposase-like protein
MPSGAVECLTKDRDALLAFYNFPAEHWDHMRTRDEVQKPFCTARPGSWRTQLENSRPFCGFQSMNASGRDAALRSSPEAAQRCAEGAGLDRRVAQSFHSS